MKFYNYALCDPRILGRWETDKFIFLYQPYYIGKGTGHRMFVHLQFAKQSKFTREIFESGNIPICVKLNENLLEDDAFNEEKFFIRQLGTIKELPNIKRGPLKNLNPGGIKGSILSEETRLKMSIAHKKENLSTQAIENLKRGNSNRPTFTYIKGIDTKRSKGLLKRSEQCKAKIRERLIGKPKSESCRLNLKKYRDSLSEEQKQQINLKIAKTCSLKWKILYENNYTIEIINLFQWCKDNPNYDITSLRRTSIKDNFYKGKDKNQIGIKLIRI